MHRILAAVTIALALAGLVVGCIRAQTPAQSNANSVQDTARPLPGPGSQVIGDKPSMPQPVVQAAAQGYRVRDYATGLEIPWAMVWPSKDRMYVTERPGRVRLIENGRLRRASYANIRNVHARGEGGLLGMALHPSYPNPGYVYLMYTYTSGGAVYNRVSRFTDTGSGLTDEQPVVARIPGAMIHDGGALRFGPDGMLYIGTGDAGDPEGAQNTQSLHGKILRVTPGGGIPPDNPFPNSPVYAYGLRNVEGLAWNPTNGDLWATMHGPSANDEVFIIRKGGNHGWPRALGVANISGIVKPVMFFPEYSVAPAGALFYTGSLMPDLKNNFLFATLRGSHLERVVLAADGKISRIERWWQTGQQDGRYGRLRAVAQGPDGALYVSTSNQDGRGRVHPGDDRILRISPQ